MLIGSRGTHTMSALGCCSGTQLLVCLHLTAAASSRLLPNSLLLQERASRVAIRHGSCALCNGESKVTVPTAYSCRAKQEFWEPHLHPLPIVPGFPRERASGFNNLYLGRGSVAQTAVITRARLESYCRETSDLAGCCNGAGTAVLDPLVMGSRHSQGTSIPPGMS